MTVPIILTRRGWSLLIAALAFWAGWLVVGLRDIWYLVAFLAASVLLAVVAACALPRFARIEVEIFATDPTPVSGDRVAVTALIRHRASFALRSRLLWRVEGRAHGDSLALSPGEPAFAELRWRTEGRGPVPVAVPAILLFDPLGLAARRVRTEAATELLILPRPLPALDQLFSGVSGRSGRGRLSGDRTLGSDAGSPAGAVREYRSGDPLRQIQWKQSARQGELLVNLHETASSAQRTLLLVREPGSYASSRDFELAVSAAATLASRWLRERHPVRILLDADQSHVYADEGEMLRALARVEPHDGNSPSVSALVPSFAPAPQAVVTGILHERLAEALAPLEGGVLLVRARIGETVAPPSWQVVEIPDPPPSGRPTRESEVRADGRAP